MLVFYSKFQQLQVYSKNIAQDCNSIKTEISPTPSTLYLIEYYSMEHAPSYDELILSSGRRLSSVGNEDEPVSNLESSPSLVRSSDGSIAPMERLAPSTAMSIVDALITPAFSPASARSRSVPIKPTFSGWMRKQQRSFPYSLQSKSVLETTTMIGGVHVSAVRALYFSSKFSLSFVFFFSTFLFLFSYLSFFLFPSRL